MIGSDILAASVPPEPLKCFLCERSDGHCARRLREPIPAKKFYRPDEKKWAAWLNAHPPASLGIGVQVELKG